MWVSETSNTNCRNRNNVTNMYCDINYNNNNIATWVTFKTTLLNIFVDGEADISHMNTAQAALTHPCLYSYSFVSYCALVTTANPLNQWLLASPVQCSTVMLVSLNIYKSAANSNMWLNQDAYLHQWGILLNNSLAVLLDWLEPLWELIVSWHWDGPAFTDASGIFFHCQRGKVSLSVRVKGRLRDTNVWSCLIIMLHIGRERVSVLQKGKQLLV